MQDVLDQVKLIDSDNKKEVLELLTFRASSRLCYLLFVSVPGGLDLDPKWVRLAKKWDKSGKFSDQIQYTLAHRAKMY